MYTRLTSLGALRQLLLLILIAVGLNFNTLFNEYAADDELVLTKNSIVAKGVLGIPEIFSSDLLAGTSDATNALKQARYRPLTLALFAVEYQFFGTNPLVSHLINVLLFVLLISLLFKLLNNHLLKGNGALAFITCLLFVVHPIHTEVIANVKSRDELLTFIFLLSSLLCVCSYISKPSYYFISSSVTLFLFALLTRESAVTFLAVLPLIFYFFYTIDLKKTMRIMLPFLGILIAYLGVRFIIVGMQHHSTATIMDSPFLFASNTEAFATKIYILFKCIVLLIYPHPLSCDYGFNQIPYVGIFSLPFAVSFLLVMLLVFFSVLGFRKKSLFGFSILYFFITMSLASNFIVDIGTPLSERLLFQPSLAICLAGAVLFERIQFTNKNVAGIALLITLLLFSIKTLFRNPQWKNNETLYLADVNSAPNSVRTNVYAAVNSVLKAHKTKEEKEKRILFQNAVSYGEHARQLFNSYPDTYLALGYAYLGLSDELKAAENWIIALRLNPNNTITQQCGIMLSNRFLEKGNALFAQQMTDSALLYYSNSVALNKYNIEAWYKLGGNYFIKNDTKNGIEAWQQVVNLAPNYPLNRADFEPKIPAIKR